MKKERTIFGMKFGGGGQHIVVKGELHEQFGQLEKSAEERSAELDNGFVRSFGEIFPVHTWTPEQREAYIKVMARREEVEFDKQHPELKVSVDTRKNWEKALGKLMNRSWGCMAVGFVTLVSGVGGGMLGYIGTESWSMAGAAAILGASFGAVVTLAVM